MSSDDNGHGGGIRDRTGEFRATVDSLHSRAPIVRRRTPTSASPGADPADQTGFSNSASRISADIQAICGQLERLAKAARSPAGILADGAPEYTGLASAIEASISRTHRDLTALQRRQQQQQHAAQDEQKHSGVILRTLESRLRSASGSLAAVLKDRERAEAEQRRRREQYSAGIKLPANLSLAAPDRLPLLADGSAPPRSTMSYQELALVQSTDTSYLQERGSAVQNIEKSISEIGHIFSQLTQMIAEQGETVQRIDANIDDVTFNIDRGHAELLKYYRYVESNRWLLLKMFAVMIVFMILLNAFVL